MCKLKLVTGSNGNLIPIKMHKMLFLLANIHEHNDPLFKKSSIAHLQ